MRLVFVCSILFQFYAAYGISKSDSRFYKNVKEGDDWYIELQKSIKDLKPVTVKENLIIITDKDIKLDDNVTRKIMKSHLYSGMKYKFPIILQKYQDYAIKKAIENIRSIPKYIVMELQVQEDKLPLIKTNMIDKFFEKAINYFDNVSKEKCTTDIDIEFLLLNSVHRFNDLLYNERIKLFNDMIAQANIELSKYEAIRIMKHFQQDLNNNKRDDMEYLCNEQNICKPTLGFTDCLGDILHEILKLSDVQLTDLFIKLSVPVKDQSEFFKTILGESTTLKLGMNWDSLLFTDDSAMRRILVALRSYLADKYVFVKNVDENTNMRNKALRILVDIIDKTFDTTGDEVLTLHFDLLLKTIAKWSLGRKNDIQKVLRYFVNQSVEIMKNNLTEDAKLEIRALVDILMRKEDNSNKIYTYLLADGSKFVRDEDVSLKLSLFL